MRCFFAFVAVMVIGCAIQWWRDRPMGPDPYHDPDSWGAQ